MSNIKILSQKTIHKADLFDVAQTKLESANGKKQIHQDVYVRPSVFVFPLTEKNEIYLIYEYRYLMKKTVLSAVAGFINNGETSIQAAKRELREETGLTANHWEEVYRVESANSVVKASSYLFLAKDLEGGERKPEEDEEIKLVKMSLLEAIEKIMIGEINDAKSIIGIFLLDKLKRERKL